MSSKRRGGLGRGLGALIPTAPSEFARPAPESSAGGVAVSEEPPELRTELSTAGFAGPTQPGTATREPHTDAGAADGAPVPVPGASFAELPVDRIHPNPKQPREVFDEEALAELAHSIREFGVLQPVIVREDADGWQLVMGERRLRAAAAAGLDTIPAIVRSTTDDAMLRDALLENIHRAQLNPLEEAAAYQQLLEEFGATHDELAQRIGRSRPQVTNTIRLLNLSLPVQRRVAAGVLSAGHARALLSLEDVGQQDELAGRIVAEGLSVRATEELVALARRGGGPAKAPRKQAASRISAPAVTELADKLSDVFDTRVRVDIGRRKGKITVEFASIDDLERIVGVMAPQIGAPARSETEQSSAGQPNVP
ncbi:MAG TPA: ParB/RepB/Spo0J family partition protein [Jatrophihabitans sp.]|nr:ParB/RepB/Spo0J family partition protein [Jatrophihabitans sp.]